jgi:hypothetical protein
MKEIATGWCILLLNENKQGRAKNSIIVVLIRLFEMNFDFDALLHSFTK